MPITARAIKKLSHDRKRTQENEAFRKKMGELVKKARKGATPKTISAAYQVLDKGVKRKIIHANKAARTKSRLAKLLKKK